MTQALEKHVRHAGPGWCVACMGHSLMHYTSNVIGVTVTVTTMVTVTVTLAVTVTVTVSCAPEEECQSTCVCAGEHAMV